MSLSLSLPSLPPARREWLLLLAPASLSSFLFSSLYAPPPRFLLFFFLFSFSQSLLSPPPLLLSSLLTLVVHTLLRQRDPRKRAPEEQYVSAHSLFFPSLFFHDPPFIESSIDLTNQPTNLPLPFPTVGLIKNITTKPDQLMSSAPVYQSHSHQQQQEQYRQPDPGRSGQSLAPSSPSRSQHQQYQQQQSPTLSHHSTPLPSTTNQPPVTFPIPPPPSLNQQQQQFQQPQFQVVSDYNLLVADSTSQIDAASTTHLHHNNNNNQQQQQQPLQEQQQYQQQQYYQDQRYQTHSRQDIDHEGEGEGEGELGGDQLHTLNGSPYTPPTAAIDTMQQSPDNDTLDKTNTDTTVTPTAAAEFTKAKLFRRRVMRMATVPRLQWLWGLLALFGSIAWFSMMPAYAFRYVERELKCPPSPPGVLLFVAIHDTALWPLLS
ncbi:MAG: hypothetical protein J3R72DRAFT_36560 [Linnemannia gamsii]|nr:MAG: hypothetical protein J3R72DRAFT_36560 [Linnemannia gamsii]